MKNTLFAFTLALLPIVEGLSIFFVDSCGIEKSITEVALEEEFIEKTTFDFIQKTFRPMMMIETDSTQKQNPLLNFFSNITGTWQVSPSDSSVISQLEYKKISNKQFILNVEIH